MKRPNRTALTALAPALWLGLFFLFPFLLVAKLSLSETALAMPPYAPRLDWSAGLTGLKAFLAGLDFETYARLTADRLYVVAYLSSLKFAGVATLILLLLGYPLAYAMSRCSPMLRQALLMAVILPFWTSFLIRVYALIGILKPEGLLNTFLRAIGVPAVSILNTETAIYIGLVYAYLPFMVLPLYAVLERQQDDLLEAAADLGCAPLEAFWRVTFPMSLPGVAAGSLLCFIPMVGEFVIPDLLGGSSTLMLGKTIWTEFFANRDWPAASAVAIVLLFTLVIPIVLYQRQQARLMESGQ
ncbi:ABC transporter permease [Phenylobacterium koreense]|uniref:Putrescine transport system permease protein n=1 Tax=Phenylobacterium koreense TaxID=266125 RepID=A0ABV2ELF0_9CAUL